MLETMILDPDEWPWANTEAQMVARDAKAHLKDAVENATSSELNDSWKSIVHQVDEGA